ncbi:MAG: six-hairpin glycosidase [Tannerella sp.]|jgi:hypothetical protein|nr:six-hairpin glycosidase [Tannerella sp.]
MIAIEMKKNIIALCATLCCISAGLQAQKIEYRLNSETGAVNRIAVENDLRNMNWILETDGSQYKWIGQEYGWGLGFFSLVSDGDSVLQKWEKPIEVKTSGGVSVSLYQVGDVRISVERKYAGNDMLEKYVFTNTGKRAIQMTDIGINTPFNDNYPDAATCMQARANAHIWEGGNAAYVNAMHQSGQAPHLGLVVTAGAVRNYEIKERNIRTSSSHARGIIILNPEDITLKPRASYTLSWRLFSHNGTDDFFARLLNCGGIRAYSSKYVYALGETAMLTFESGKQLKNPALYQDGEKLPLKAGKGTYTASAKINRTGETRFELVYDGGKKTQIVCLGISSEEELIRKRASFIMEHQQLNDTSDERYGAYMVYDNETDRIFMNDKPSASYHDRDEGAERMGMGVFLTMYYQKTKDPKVKESLLKYARFVRNKLQDDEYQVWSTVDHKGRNRGYNYPLVANLYFQMFQVTNDRQFLLDGYRTMRAFYNRFGYGFYAICIPAQLSLKLLRENGLNSQADSLLSDYKQSAEIYLKNGINYPRHEVNYEQSIVAPAIILLAEMYLITGDKKYLDGASLQLPPLESFGGQQPSYHLNDIGIRHWDGYWFGKREMWGDVMPHYWSTQSAIAFDLYAQCTGEQAYHHKALNIVRNNLCLFAEDGRGSCAYIYPYRVNGVRAQFYDPYANDQDWALVYFLTLNDAK